MTVHDAHGNPRFCGMPSNVINELQRWPDGFQISYGVLADTLTNKVPMHDQITDLSTALIVWGNASQLNVEALETANPREGAVDITLAYRLGAHGDGQPFDDAGGVVGHAWFPPDGRIHHDNAEDWTASYRERVTLHEVGHALGIGHASELGNVMYPYVTNQTELGSWDLAQIQQRYGIDPLAPPDDPPPTIPPPPMLWGIRRENIALDGEAVDPARMIKMFVHDATISKRIAESAYYEDGFFLFEIPQCQRFSVQMTSPALTVFEGPWDWQSGALVWQQGLDFVTQIETPEEPEPSPWLPWREAEIRSGQLGTQIRFLDTRGDS